MITIADGIIKLKQLMIPTDSKIADENLSPELCSECKGRCCKNMGCELFPEQFAALSTDPFDVESNTEIVIDILSTTIVSLDGGRAMTRLLDERNSSESETGTDILSIRRMVVNACA